MYWDSQVYYLQSMLPQLPKYAQIYNGLCTLVLLPVLVLIIIQQRKLLDHMDLSAYLQAQRFVSYFKQQFFKFWCTDLDTGGCKVILLLWRHGGCSIGKRRRFRNSKVHCKIHAVNFVNGIMHIIDRSHWDKRTLNSEVMNAYISRYNVITICQYVYGFP